MRKLMVGLMVVGLLAVAAPAMAQAPGALDPLGLITSGAILPYVGSGTNASWLEVTSPSGSASIHMFFFDTTCTRQGDSANLFVTENDVEFFRLDNLGNTPTSGLATAADTADGFTLIPQLTPLHMRVLWVNVPSNFVRVIDAISASTLDNDRLGEGGFYNPLRTGAAFFAPLAGSGLETTIYFVCPNQNIVNNTASASTTRAFTVANGFPPLIPDAQLAGAATPLRVLVYDDQEDFLRDTTSSCNCLTAHPVTDISPVYASVVEAPFGTYSEVSAPVRQVTTPPVCDFTTFDVLAVPGVPNSGNGCPLVPPVAPATVATLQYHQITPAVTASFNVGFTGYRSIVSTTNPPLNVFGRLSNANACDLNAPGCNPQNGR